MLNVWHIYLHSVDFDGQNMVNVGTYTSPTECLGYAHTPKNSLMNPKVESSTKNPKSSLSNKDPVNKTPFSSP